MQIGTALLIVVALLLVAAHRRLTTLEAGVRKLLELQGCGAAGADPSDDVKRLAASGDRIEAMRLYRQQSGADVRVAKRVVDAWIDKTPR